MIVITGKSAGLIVLNGKVGSAAQKGTGYEETVYDEAMGIIQSELFSGGLKECLPS